MRCGDLAESSLGRCQRTPPANRSLSVTGMIIDTKGAYREGNVSPEEAAWFERNLRSRAASELSPLLNVGSSTLEYRSSGSTQIDRLLLGPLVARGVEVVHVDLKEDPGVDLVGDITDPAFRVRIAQIGAKAILCNNLLEHVHDPPAMCRALADICPPGGTLCLSVPHAFPFHPDPIDNGFRPSLGQLSEIFAPSGFAFSQGDLVDFGSYGEALAGNPRLLLRDTYLLALAPFHEEKRKVLLGNYAFFRRRFQVACAIFTKISR